MNKGHKYSYKIVIIFSSRSLLLCTMVQWYNSILAVVLKQWWLTVCVFYFFAV